MDREEVRRMLVTAISEIQENSGRVVGALDDNVRPLVDLEGFDSLNGEEVTTMLLEDLILNDDPNPFASEDDHDLTIGEITDRLAKTAMRREKVS
jgi:hypothetical protein